MADEYELYIAIGQFQLSLSPYMSLGSMLPKGVEFLCPVYKTSDEAQKAIDEYLDGNGFVEVLTFTKKEDPEQEGI